MVRSKLIALLLIKYKTAVNTKVKPSSQFARYRKNRVVAKIFTAQKIALMVESRLAVEYIIKYLR